MAFGLGPSSTAAVAQSSVTDPLQFLNSREPPPLRIAPKTAPSGASRTKIPLDGLFSDEDDDLFPAFDSAAAARPRTAVVTEPAPLPLRKKTTPQEDAVAPSSSSLLGDTSAATSSPSTRPVTASIFDRLAPKAPSPSLAVHETKPPTGTKSIFDSSPSVHQMNTNSRTGDGFLVQQGPTTGPASMSSSSLLFGSKAPVKSSLFKNLVAPPWEQPSVPPTSESSASSEPVTTKPPLTAPAAAPVSDKAVNRSLSTYNSVHSAEKAANHPKIFYLFIYLFR